MTQATSSDWIDSERRRTVALRTYVVSALYAMTCIGIAIWILSLPDSIVQWILALPAIAVLVVSGWRGASGIWHSVHEKSLFALLSESIPAFVALFANSGLVAILVGCDEHGGLQSTALLSGWCASYGVILYWLLNNHSDYISTQYAPPRYCLFGTVLHAMTKTETPKLVTGLASLGGILAIFAIVAQLVVFAFIWVVVEFVVPLACALVLTPFGWYGRRLRSLNRQPSILQMTAWMVVSLLPGLTTGVVLAILV